MSRGIGSAAVSSNEGFCLRLRLVGKSGWDSAAGSELLAEFAARCGRVAGRVFASGDLSLAESLADDLAGRMWEHVDTHRETYLTARSAWGVFQAQARLTCVQVTEGHRWLTEVDGGSKLPSGSAVARPVRAGDEAVLALMADGSAVSGCGSELGRTALVRCALDQLVDGLAGAGMDRGLAVESVGAAVDILLAHQSRHLAHTRAYADPVLTGLLPRDAIRSLMNLLIGTRRGGPESSALAALVSAAGAGDDLALADATRTSRYEVRVLSDSRVLPLAG